MKHWMLWLLAGIIAVVCGVWALINPSAAGTTTEVLVGGGCWLLVGCKDMRLIPARASRRAVGPFWGRLLRCFWGFRWCWARLAMAPFCAGS